MEVFFQRMCHLSWIFWDVLLLLSCCIWLRVARVDPALPCLDSRVGLGHARWPYAVLLFSELGREFASRTETESFSAFVWT